MKRGDEVVWLMGSELVPAVVVGTNHKLVTIEMQRRGVTKRVQVHRAYLQPVTEDLEPGREADAARDAPSVPATLAPVAPTTQPEDVSCPLLPSVERLLARAEQWRGCTTGHRRLLEAIARLNDAAYAEEVLKAWMETTHARG